MALRDVARLLPDKVTGFIGSWRFVLGGLSLLVAWAAANFVLAEERGWDPYPFVFLNLMLGVQSAFIGPIIMMSQRRQEERDKQTAGRELRLTRDFETLTNKVLEGLRHNELSQSIILGRVETLLVEFELRQRAMEEQDEQPS